MSVSEIVVGRRVEEGSLLDEERDRSSWDDGGRKVVFTMRSFDAEMLGSMPAIDDLSLFPGPVRRRR